MTTSHHHSDSPYTTSLQYLTHVSLSRALNSLPMMDCQMTDAKNLKFIREIVRISFFYLKLRVLYCRKKLTQTNNLYLQLLLIISYYQMDNQDSSLYLFFRPLIKYFIHKITGQTQIQRVARRGEVQSLDKSIALSKALITYRNRHCHWNNPYQEQLCQELCAIKNIQNQDSFFRVNVVLQELHSWKYAINYIENIRKTRYDSQSQSHQTKLMDIWRNLRPNRQIKGRKSNQWIQLGFQADDPATDFRGAGLLGLINLHGWVEKQRGKDAFQVADTKGTEYFFASASLFLTMLSVQVIKNMQVPPQFWILKPGNTIQWLFQILFQQIFVQFADFWLGVQDKSLMQFNTNLTNFSKLVKQSRIKQISLNILLKRL